MSIGIQPILILRSLTRRRTWYIVILLHVGCSAVSLDKTFNLQTIYRDALDAAFAVGCPTVRGSSMRFHEDSRICAFASQRTVFASSVRPATLVVSDGRIQEISYGTGEDVVRYFSQVNLAWIVRGRGLRNANSNSARFRSTPASGLTIAAR